MAQGDITLSENSGSNGSRGSRLHNVAAGTPIYAGEPVQMVLGGNVVFPAITSTPVVGTTYFVGIAQTNSTNTVSAAGTVDVIPLTNQETWLIAPATAATWDTQAEYDALVGDRVTLANSVSVTATPASGTYTINASDGATNGCVIQTLNVFLNPGKVAFAFRNGASYLA